MALLPIKHETTVNDVSPDVVMWKTVVVFVYVQMEIFTVWNFSFVRVKNKIKSTAFQRMNLFVSSGTIVNQTLSCAPQARLF
jgi:hypothetical protein